MPSLHRYPPTTDRSLRVSSQADELLLDWARQSLLTDVPTTVVHDRFGAVALRLSAPVQFIASYHSQEEALRRNAGGYLPANVARLTDASPVTHQALLRVPKSLELFEYYLAYLGVNAVPGARLAAGFMTRHFTPRLLEISARYAGTVTQSRARKKARLLLLSDLYLPAPESGPRPMLRNVIDYQGARYTQYYGVFSSQHVDFATQFLLDSWPDDLPAPASILDIGCGSGIIGDQLLRRYPAARLTATDDFSLAVASARENLPADRATVRYAHTLATVADASQELVVTNPPFHQGYENTLDTSLSLFGEVQRVLTPAGQFFVVANRHLNYATHLRRLFREVTVVRENAKYVVYRCGRSPVLTE
ncbi:class I SAM-dependent methyltransferase [Neolewinella sp.]|uniref:class I SAM-dependent methyltransferase n=1 Tax=Neolewinella sp. TaxID=2993543 RepID=UPI003B529AF3